MSRPLGSRLTPEHRAAIAAGIRRLGRTVERTEALSAALIEMRARGLTQEKCAKKLGVAVTVCRRWCAELGMSRVGPSSAAFRKISAGLTEAIAIARGEAEPARIFVPRKKAEAPSPGRSALPSPASSIRSNADQKA